MKFFFTLLFVSLVGCTSIDQPTAQRQLVEDYFSIEHKLVSSELWSALLNEDVGHILNLEGQKVYLGKLYVSASGQICRKLFLENVNPTHFFNLSCKSNLKNSWYFVESVLAEYADKQNNQGAGI